MNEFPMLTCLTLAPLLGALIVFGLPVTQEGRARPVALGCSGLTLALVGLVLGRFDPATADYQFVERHAWMPTLNVDYFLGLDGLGLLMLALTALLVPLALLATARGVTRPRLYHGLVLALQSGLFGTFTALNFVHWFLFWELSLIPAFFLIRWWGGPRRAEVSVRFFLYTMVGSVTLLLAFLALRLATGFFSFPDLAELGRSGGVALALSTKLQWYALSAGQLAMLVFLGAFLGFAIKVPLMPFHTWLPDTYAEAPTPVTMLLTGLMSKMGVYGFLRILVPIFPEQIRAALPVLLGLAVLTIVCAAGAAFAQRDLKRLLAYSSINHLGYCLLGALAAAGGGVGATPDTPRLASEQAAALLGVMLQMFNHGLTAAALFCCVGWLEERSGGARGLDDFGGLRQVAPVFCGLMGMAVFASLGLPGLNGFVGEFLIFKGTFPLAPWAAVLALPGLLITAVFLLTLLQKVFHGPLPPRWAGFADLTVRERWVLGPAVALMFLLGVWPQLVLGFLNQTVLGMVDHLKF